jgi:hypothetical protein
LILNNLKRDQYPEGILSINMVQFILGYDRQGKGSHIFNQISFHCVSYCLSTVLILPSLHKVQLHVYFPINDRTTIACIKKAIETN